MEEVFDWWEYFESISLIWLLVYCFKASYFCSFAKLMFCVNRHLCVSLNPKQALFKHESFLMPPFFCSHIVTALPHSIFSWDGLATAKICCTYILAVAYRLVGSPLCPPKPMSVYFVQMRRIPIKVQQTNDYFGRLPCLLFSSIFVRRVQYAISCLSIS